VAEFVYQREGADHVVVVLRVPKVVWDRWEFRHKHFGKAIHALRESCVEIMSTKHLSHYDRDQADPFFRS
jgi:hypothetical protein